MRFTAGEKIAIQLALEEQIRSLQNDIKRWEGQKVVEDCEVLLATAQSALSKIKSA